MIQSPVLVLPGLSSSGPTHWQTLWENQHPEFVRVEQQDWFDPDPAHWVHNIDTAVSNCQSPPILIAHSLATIALGFWARSHSRPIRGAFLVAPADVESPNPHSELLKSFIPIPMAVFPFPSIVIASTNDPYAKLERVKAFATAWGSQIRILGPLGHINAQSGLGEWPEGYEIFNDWNEKLL